jgi:hypothetical protein
VAPINVPSLLAQDASLLYAKNQYNLLKLMLRDIISIEWTDEVRGSYDLIVHLEDVNDAFAATRCRAGDWRERYGESGRADRQTVIYLWHADSECR